MGKERIGGPNDTTRTDQPTDEPVGGGSTTATEQGGSTGTWEDPTIPNPEEQTEQNDFLQDEFYSEYAKLFQYSTSSYGISPSKNLYIGFYENSNLIYYDELLDGTDYEYDKDNNILVYPSGVIRRNVDDYNKIKHKLLDVRVSYESGSVENLAIREISPDKTELKLFYMMGSDTSISSDWKFIVNNINILYDKYNYFLKYNNKDHRIINAKLDSSYYNEQLQSLNDKKEKLMHQLFKEFDANREKTLMSASLNLGPDSLWDEDDIGAFISNDKRFQELIKEYEFLQGYYYLDLKVEAPIQDTQNKKVKIYRRDYNPFFKKNVVFWQSVNDRPLLSDEYFSSERGLTRQTVSSSLEDLASGSNSYQLKRYFDLLYDKNNRIDNLNIDYSEFSNFIYFGTATGQVENAYNKCLNYSSSYHSASRFDIIDTFTPYQQWVYDYKFRQYTPSEFASWYNEQYASASIYDNNNKYSLIKNVPEEMKTNEANENLILLMKSYGDFFDDIKAYVDSFGNLFNFDYDYNKGLPKEIIYTFSDFFGWKLYESYDLDALQTWLRLNLTNETAITGSADATREKWLRILGCIPYLNKIRGTRKAIDAILNIYGIPNTLLDVHEYGGYNEDVTQSYEITQYDYYLNFTDSSQYITIPESIVSSSIHDENYTIEMMFKPSQALTSSYLFSSSVESGSAYFTQNELTSSYGNIVFKYNDITSSFDSDFELYNTSYWYHFIYQVSGSNQIKMYAKVFDDSSMVIDEETSASIDITGSSLGIAPLYMYLDYLGGSKEIRFWNHVLDEDEINQHVYNYSDISVKDGLSNNYLQAWYKLNDNKILSASEYFNDFSPSPKTDCSSSGFSSNPFIGFSMGNLVQYKYFNIDKYNDNNIIIDNTVSQSLGTQDTKQAINNNKIDLLFRPNNIINKTAIETFSLYDFNNIAKPQYYYTSKYDELNTLNNYYVNYYDNNINYNDYIRYIRNFDMSLMRMIEQVVPERAILDKGILLENTILQRQKIQHRRPTISQNNPDGEIIKSYTIISNLANYTGDVDCSANMFTHSLDFLFYGDKTINNNYLTINKQLKWATYLGTQVTKESDFFNNVPVEVSQSAATRIYVKP